MDVLVGLVGGEMRIEEMLSVDYGGKERMFVVVDDHSTKWNHCNRAGRYFFIFYLLIGPAQSRIDPEVGQLLSQCTDDPIPA